MASDFISIVPGQSLNSFTPLAGFFINSVRIDNPTGCWYQIQNNRQIIPPFTYGLIADLDSGTQSLTILFIPNFAGQTSKVVGNPVYVYVTDAVLPANNPLPIDSSVPYVNTFSARGGATGGATTSFPVSIFPTVPMRIRIVEWELWWNSVNPANTPLSFFLFVIDFRACNPDGTGTIVSSRGSVDNDSAVISQTTVRSDMTVGTGPTVIGQVLVSYNISVNTPGNNMGLRFGRSYNLQGPEFPPAVTCPASGALNGFAINHAASVNIPSYNWRIIWTEEPFTSNV